MSFNLGTSLNMAKNQIINFLIHKLAAAPSSPVEAMVYYNTVDKRFCIHDGSQFQSFANLNDLTSFITATSTNTLTNKSIDADTNTIANIEVDNFKSGVIDTDLNSVSTLHDTLASAKAIKAYIDAVSNAVASWAFKGGIDCSANPNYPAADSGDTYKVTVAGKIGGASGKNVMVGDQLICTTNGTASGNQATVGANWLVMQSEVDYADTTEAELKSDNVKVLTPASVANFTIKKGFTFGNGSATSFVLTHNLNSRDVLVRVYQAASPYEEIWPNIIHTDLNTTTLEFTNAPASNEYRAIVIG